MGIVHSGTIESIAITFLSLKLWRKVLPPIAPRFSSQVLMLYGMPAGIQEVLVTELMVKENQVGDCDETPATGGFLNRRSNQPTYGRMLDWDLLRGVQFQP